MSAGKIGKLSFELNDLLYKQNIIINGKKNLFIQK